MTDTKKATAHTPGPWVIERDEHGNSVSLDAFDIITNAPGILLNYICEVQIGDPNDTKEAEANARLISAAPDLLLSGKEMCLLLREIMKEVRPGSTVLQTYQESPAFKRMMDAIKKAEGTSLAA